jgi:hypothetical protein
MCAFRRSTAPAGPGLLLVSVPLACLTGPPAKLTAVRLILSLARVVRWDVELAGLCLTLKDRGNRRDLLCSMLRVMAVAVAS